MFAVRRILHPTDFSPQAERAFQAACDLAEKYAAALVLLHVDRPMVLFDDMDPEAFRDPTSRQHAEAQLELMRPPNRRLMLQRQVVDGEPSAEIVQVAKDKSCDLIVMGSHGRRGISRFLLGSVAQDVLHSAPCPVLIINRDASERAIESSNGFAEVSSHNVSLTSLLGQLLQVLKIQARETERLVEHVERHTDRLLEPSQMGLVVSELTALQAHLDGVLAIKS